MTPLETAQEIVDKFAPRMSLGEGARKQLRDEIHAALIECSNAELERRREAERRIEALGSLRIESKDGWAALIVEVDGVTHRAPMVRMGTVRDDS